MKHIKKYNENVSEQKEKLFVPDNLDEIYKILFSSNDKNEFKKNLIDNGYNNYVADYIFYEIEDAAEREYVMIEQDNEYLEKENKKEKFTQAFINYVEKLRKDDFNNIPISDDFNKHVKYTAENIFKFRLKKERDRVENWGGFALYIKEGELDITEHGVEKKYKKIYKKTVKYYNAENLFEQ